MTIRPPSLVLVILAVQDLARMVRFYREAFGWKQEVDVPVYAELAMPNGMRLGLYAEKSFAINTREAPPPTPPGAITRTELYLHCDDLPRAVETVIAAGARVLAPLAPRDWGDEAAYFADPEGNVFVLAWPAVGA